jgi:hypothetical protein
MSNTVHITIYGILILVCVPSTIFSTIAMAMGYIIGRSDKEHVPDDKET